MILLKKVFYFILLISLFHCGNKENKDKQNLQNLFLLYYFNQQVKPNTAEEMAKIYYINPLIKATSNLNLEYVSIADSSTVNSSKKKLVMVHGWDFEDRDSKSLPSLQELKDRIINQNWADFIKSNLFTNIISKNYDIYAFDYLTSNGVDVNGKRFRARMDELFKNETGTVIIHGHSMGGLITRFALYEGETPKYISRIITTGTPYHGSPWASPEYQADRGTIGKLASYMTDTTGGKDLAWDNFDGKISGASNSKLTSINAKKDRDSLVYAYYSSITNSGSTDSGASSPGLSLACPILGSNFSPSDCIVPQTSATLSGNSFAVTRDMGRYDHYDIKLQISSIQTLFYNDLP